MTGARRSLVARAGVGLTANVVQHSTLRLSSIAVDRPAVIFLRHGTKTLKLGAREWTAEGGDAIAISGGNTFDVFNRLDAGGLFEARWIVWDPELLASAQPGATAATATPDAATVRPVDQIVSEVGYESASRFAVRFRSRFGFAPSVVRGHRRSA